jgi:hypothetical protein
MINLSPSLVATITGVLIPIVAALFLRSNFPEKVKVVVSLVLNAIFALLTNALNDHGYAVLSWEMLGTYLQQVVIATAAYLGFYKPFNINDRTPTLVRHGE